MYSPVSTSSQLRAGDVTVLAVYEEHDRLRGGTSEEAAEQAYRGWLADHLDGKDTILMTRTEEQARELSSRARVRRLTGRDSATGHARWSAFFQIPARQAARSRNAGSERLAGAPRRESGCGRESRDAGFREALSDRVHTQPRMAVRKIVVPAAWKTASNEAVKFDPWSRITNRKSPNRSVRAENLVRVMRPGGIR